MLSVIKSFDDCKEFPPELHNKRLFTDERYREIHYIHLMSVTTTRKIFERGLESRKRMENSYFLRFVIVSQASIISHSAPSEVFCLCWEQKKKYREKIP